MLRSINLIAKSLTDVDLMGLINTYGRDHIPADRRLKISTKVDRSLAFAVASSPSIASRPLGAPLLISV
jgi:hypothetical protein